MKQWYKTDIERIIVIYDDVDRFRVIRIRPSGSAGTHNVCVPLFICRKAEFPGKSRHRPAAGRLGPGGLCIEPLSEEEVEAVKQACSRAVKGVECILSLGVEQAMSRFNG